MGGPQNRFPQLPEGIPEASTLSREACRKCASEAATVALPARALCKLCFQAHIQRTYKVALGRLSYNPRSPHPVAILVSGGPASAAAALLHRAHLSSIRPHPGASPHDAVLVHVRESPDSERAVQSLSRECGLRLHVVPVPSIAKLSDPTDRAALQRARATHLALSAADDLGARVAISGTTTDRAAVDVLERVLGGAGQSVARASATHVLSGDVTLLRPLLHIPIRQVVRFQRDRAPHIATATFGGAPQPRDIRGVLERFVEESQAENASCVHNIVRTSSRLLCNDDRQAKCRLCDGPVYGVSSSSALDPGALSATATDKLPTSRIESESTYLTTDDRDRSRVAQAKNQVLSDPAKLTASSHELCHNCVGTFERADAGRGGTPEASGRGSDSTMAARMEAFLAIHERL